MNALLSMNLLTFLYKGDFIWQDIQVYVKIVLVLAIILLLWAVIKACIFFLSDMIIFSMKISEENKKKKEHRLAQEQLKKDKQREDAFERLVQLAMSQRDEWKDRTLTLEELRDGDLICIKYGDIDEIFKVIYIRRFECNLVDTVYFKGLYFGTEGFWLSSKTNSQDPRQHVDSYMIIKLLW